MPKYFVRSESRLRVRLATYEQLRQANRPHKRFMSSDSTQPSFVVYDLVQSQDDLSVPDGLGIDAHIEASGIAEAIRQCFFAANFLVDVLTFATQAEPSAANFVLAYDATPGVERRELVAHNSLGRAVVSRRLKDYLLPPILEAANALRREGQSSTDAADRIERVDLAMKWLRKGVGETAILDEFTAYWVGLEVLDPIIRPVQRIFRTCPECGKAVDHCNHCGKEIAKGEKTTNVLEGVRFIMEERLAIKKGVFNRIRSMRGALLHGGKGLQRSELETLTTYIPHFRRGLIHAICLALHLDEQVTAELALPDPRRMQSHPIQRLREFVLIDDVPSLDEIDKQPRIELGVANKLTLSGNNDDILENRSCAIREINCRLAPDTQRIAEILSDPFSGLRPS
jgi:hypothetical protein